MKVSIFVSCCILTLFCISVHGDLQFSLGAIPKVATKVKEDVRSFLQIKTTDKANEGSITFKNSEEEVPIYTTKAPEVTPGASIQRSDVETTTVTVITSTTAKTNTSEKDGRENFVAGCATGFMRTADGRCKPTF